MCELSKNDNPVQLIVLQLAHIDFIILVAIIRTRFIKNQPGRIASYWSTSRIEYVCCRSVLSSSGDWLTAAGLGRQHSDSLMGNQAGDHGGDSMSH